MSSSPVIVGIDLGTTNCAVAFTQADRGVDSPVIDFPVVQLQRPGQAGPQSLLPSCLYLPGEHELPAGATAMPWGEAPRAIIGEFARWQGARVPNRLVVSAKSWLCHPGVDRSAPILPWGAPAEIPKLSPTEASSLLLRHMAGAWNAANPDYPLAEQEVVITVPASFDEMARALTVNAAHQAGLTKFTLVEEPLAAFYDFTSHHRQNLTAALKDVKLVLVVDVGGGTSDFTLIEAAASPEGPVLRRIAVGDHLMLGGDNMDAALARRVEERLIAGGRKLSTTQWAQLVQASRTAKEALLGPNPPAQHGISLLAEGSRLFGGTLSSELTRDETETLILDGFFPRGTATDRPRRSSRTALQELGLPYAQDPAITRHLAAFLAQHAAVGFHALGLPQSDEALASGVLPRPDAILLNGGVFNSARLTARLVEVLSSWWPDRPAIPLLQHVSLELAVARGAAYYGLVRRGLGRRIGGGAAHAFYVGLAEDKKGSSAMTRAVCLIPRGQEEGQNVELSGQSFALTLGLPVQFPLFSTTSDRVDRPGDIVELSDDFRPLPPIHTLLRAADPKANQGAVSVFLRATLTEIGTLELSCVSSKNDERWRLEFELRGSGSTATTPTVTESMPPEFSEVRAIFDRVYGAKPQPVESKDVKHLGRTLEQALGPRESWSVPLLREMWSTLFTSAVRRRRSAEHERMFFHLLGYSLRPGFGYPLDEWRCEQTSRLFNEWVTFHNELAIWNEFWILWRRIASGLSEAQQTAIWDFLKPHLAKRAPPQPSKNAPKPKGVQADGLEEMVRTAASLELIEPSEKAILGDWIAARIKSPVKTTGAWAWALGRLGAREPIHGSSHKTVDTIKTAKWLSLLLDLGIRKVEGGAFAVAQLARKTGDRARDIDDDLRAKAIEALKAAEASERWIQMVSEVVVLEAAEEARALGDTLPLGLILR